MMKLSKTQQEVVDLMRQGWELGALFGGFFSRCWLQKGGIGRGGESKTVSFATLYALKRKGVIIAKPKDEHDGFEQTRYKLSSKQ